MHYVLITLALRPVKLTIIVLIIVVKTRLFETKYLRRRLLIYSFLKENTMFNQKLEELKSKMLQHDDVAFNQDFLNLTDRMSRSIMGGDLNSTCTNSSCSNDGCTDGTNSTCNNSGCDTKGQTNTSCQNTNCTSVGGIGPT
jgi:hypothetical protein